VTNANARNRTKTLLTLAAVAMVTVVFTATPAHAQLTPQLGILDLNANGGINPATGAPWAAGDKYRFAFTSSELTDATSSNITTYNDFVQNLANASSLNIGAAQGVAWNVIASTANTTARDNTSTNIGVNGTGETIYLLDGSTIVSEDYEDLWNGDGGATQPRINKTEELGNPINISHGSVWAGTFRNAYPDANYGTQDTFKGPLGSVDESMGGLYSPANGTQWIWRFNFTTDTELPIYALSDPLMVTGPAAAPEPSTLFLSLLGLVGLLAFRRRRNR